MQVVSCLAEEMLLSEEGFCFMESDKQQRKIPAPCYGCIMFLNMQAFSTPRKVEFVYCISLCLITEPYCRHI